MSIKEDRANYSQRAYDKLENLKAERAELNDKLGMCFRRDSTHRIPD